MTTLPMKKGDRLPSITAQLLGPTGAVLDLTACSVRFTMRSSTGAILINRATASITDALNGRVQYEWGVTDTATIGVHDAEWTVIYPGGREMTIPNRGYDKIDITARLA